MRVWRCEAHLQHAHAVGGAEDLVRLGVVAVANAGCR